MKIVLSGTELESDEDVGALVSACGVVGAKWVELWYPKNVTPLGLEASLERLRRARISIACVGTATELGGEGDVSHSQRTIIEAIELAAEVGCSFVNTYFGWRSERDDTRAIDAYRRNLDPCLAAAEHHGVAITLENEFDGFGLDPRGSDVTRRPESIVRLMECVESERFRLTFDACNAYFAGLEPHHGFYDIVAPYVAYVHAKDGVRVGVHEETPAGWRRFNDHGREYVTCPLGEGAVQWIDLLGSLAGNGYGGFLVLEPHATRGTLEAAWRHAAAYIRQATGGGAE